MAEWIEVGKLIASAAFGFASSTGLFVWKERKEAKKEANANYNEALAIAAKNREVANDGLMILYEVVQKIQASPLAEDLVAFRLAFQAAITNIGEPNAKSSEDFYTSIYKHDTEMSVADSRILLKKAKHFLANNEAGNRAIMKKLGLVEVSLQLQLVTPPK